MTGTGVNNVYNNFGEVAEPAMPGDAGPVNVLLLQSVDIAGRPGMV